MGSSFKFTEVDELYGKTLKKCFDNGDEIIFVTEDDERYELTHFQDCCENVYIESIVGDLEDLVGSPILIAEEVSDYDAPPMSEYEESYTWTFYKFATVKGWVDVRFYGSSNGYYSESVDFIKRMDK